MTLPSEEAIPIEPIAKLSKTAIFLMIGTVAIAAACVGCHTHAHSLACRLQVVAMISGALALLKIVNSVSAVLPKPIRTTIHWLHAMTFEVLALLAVWALHLCRGKRFDRPVGAANGQPILLIHGYCNDGTVWTYHRRKLVNAGLGPIHIIHLGYPFRSIKDLAKKVADKLAEIARETNRSDALLIGHSMGGVVASYYATQMAPLNTISGVITLGSPLAGTHVAKIGIGPNAREMERNSPLIKQLNQAIRQAPNICFYHIGTKTDQLIIPADSATTGLNLSRECRFEDIGHASLLFSPRVASRLLAWLKPIEP